MEFWDAVLVVERDGVAVIHRLLEVVDARRSRRRPRLVRSSPAISGVPVKPMKAAFGRAFRMFSAKVSYWLRCASSVMTMMSALSESFGIPLALLGPELLDQGEDVAVVFASAAASGARALWPARCSSGSITAPVAEKFR